MDNLLIQEELLSLLKEATQASHVQLEPCVWQNAYENFCRHAEKLTESECSSKVMRTIDHARIELEQIPKRLYAIPDRDTTAELYCSKALNVLRGELRIITFELSHPTFAGQNEKDVCLPAASERRVPSYELGGNHYSFLRNGTVRNGRKKTRKTHRNYPGLRMGIQYYNTQLLRNAAINRKIHQTPLLDKMREILIRLSQQ